MKLDLPTAASPHKTTLYMRSGSAVINFCQGQENNGAVMLCCHAGDVCIDRPRTLHHGTVWTAPFRIEKIHFHSRFRVNSYHSVYSMNSACAGTSIQRSVVRGNLDSSFHVSSAGKFPEIPVKSQLPCPATSKLRRVFQRTHMYILHVYSVLGRLYRR